MLKRLLSVPDRDNLFNGLWRRMDIDRRNPIYNSPYAISQESFISTTGRTTFVTNFNINSGWALVPILHVVWYDVDKKFIKSEKICSLNSSTKEQTIIVSGNSYKYFRLTIKCPYSLAKTRLKNDAYIKEA